MQTAKGSRDSYAKVEQNHGWQTTVTPELAGFIAELDMFYLGTSSAAGQPYIQYRGGPAGFLKVIDEKTIGFADFGGNQQYITLGNLSENPQAFIFLIDYVRRRRIKLWGKAKVIEDDPELVEELQDSEYPGRAERAVLFSVESWDVNCPQHIHKRLPEREVAQVIDNLNSRISELEAELATVSRERATA